MAQTKSHLMHWGGFFVLEINFEGGDLIRHPEISASSPEELQLMGRMGTAWASAIGWVWLWSES